LGNRYVALKQGPHSLSFLCRMDLDDVEDMMALSDRPPLWAFHHFVQPVLSRDLDEAAQPIDGITLYLDIHNFSSLISEPKNLLV